MISYVILGTNAILRAKRFYKVFLPALRYDLEEGPEGLSYAVSHRMARQIRAMMTRCESYRDPAVVAAA